MKVYEVSTANRNALLNEDDWSLENPRYNSRILGSKKRYFKKPVYFKFYNLDDHIIEKTTEKSRICNISFSQGSIDIYLDEKATSCLTPLLNTDCELFDAVNGIYHYKRLHIKSLLENTLDYKQSEIKWLNESEKRAIRLIKPVFNEKTIKDVILFRPSELFNEIYVTDKFVEVCRENNLTGIAFYLLWDSEQEPFTAPFERIEF